MKRRIPYTRQWLLAVLLPMLILSACNLPGGGESTDLTATPRTKNVQTPSSTSSIQLGVQPCPEAVKMPSYWISLVNLTPSQKVEGVICGYLMGIPALQAVVKIRAGGNNRPLDIAVYTSLASAKPSRIFSLKGLAYGEANISKYNTLLTMQIDQGAQQSQIQYDIYREFKWSDEVRTLGQVTFVGIYPDMTRYQAEFEQGEVNAGRGSQQWRLSAVTTAQNFAEFELGWKHAVPTTVVSGGGTHDANAVLLVKNPSADNTTIKLSLSRLEFNTNGGIWEVTDVATDGLTITSPKSAQQLTSPVQVRGVNTAFAGNSVTITLFNQDHGELSQARSVTGKTDFSASIPYTSNVQGKEMQEGILALSIYNEKHVLIGATMMKILLNT